MTVKFGILGVAGIASVVTEGLLDAPSVELVAVGSRSLEKAQAFVDRFETGRAYGSYDEVLDDPQVEAVYVPLPSSLLQKWVIRAVDKNKHVLCDKPLWQADALKDVLELCARKELLFMDATHFPHSSRMKKVVEAIEAGDIGVVTKVNAAFSWPVSPPNIRLDPELEPLGALGDLGWYCVKVAQSVLGFDNPGAATAEARADMRMDNGAIVSCRAMVFLEQNKSLAFDCAFAGSGMRQWVEFVGERGTIVINDFVLPANGSTVLVERSQLDPTSEFVELVNRSGSNQKDLQVQVPNIRTTVRVRNRDDLSQLSLMFEDFASAISSEMQRVKWGQEALATQTIVDLIYRSMQEK